MTITKRDKTEVIDLTCRIKELIKNAGHPWFKDEILKRLPGVTDTMLYNAINNSEQIMLWKNKKGTCLENIQICEI